MSQRSLAKSTAATLAAAGWLLVVSNVQAVEPNQPGGATIENFVPVSAVCHPTQGPCAKVVIAGEAKGTIAPEQPGPFDRYGIGSRCHPAYAPSWLTCKKRAETMRVAGLAK